MDLRDRRLVLKATYQFIRGRTMGVVRLEDEEVGGVVARTLRFVGMGLDVQSLAVEVWVVLDDGEDKGVVGHYDLDVVGLLGVSLQVRDREVNSSKSFVLYKPRRHNVRPVFGWGVVGQCRGDPSELPGLSVAHGGPIGVTERGRFIANWYGKAELGVGNGSVWNITRMSVGTDGRTTLKEVEVVTGRGGTGDGDGGSSANNVWGVIF